MRQVSDAFATRLRAETTSLCACWRFERRDGQVFGATDHDRTLVLDGVSHEPAHALAGAMLESGAGFAPGRAALEGALDAGFLSEADLAAGLWDGARVDVWRVDWRAPEHRVRVWSGRLSEIARTGAGFAAELVSLKADLERPVGRVFSRQCDANVGDARCGVGLSAAAFRGEGVVVEALGGGRVKASGLEAFADGWFAMGRLTWTSGANTGLAGRVASHRAGAPGDIDLAAPPRFAAAVGDGFLVTAGCDKAFATCKAKFANTDNFRGFPHMPGNDAVLAGPASDRANDGGRR
jgi:uncharacterized phage protein (TIGR02218 family)